MIDDHDDSVADDDDADADADAVVVRCGLILSEEETILLLEPPIPLLL